MSATVIALPVNGVRGRSAQIGNPETGNPQNAGRAVVLMGAPKGGATGRPGTVPNVGAQAESVSTHLRLTRRGRVVLAALAVLLAGAIVAVLAVMGASRAEAVENGGGAEFGYVVVQPGESLWSVASHLDPGSDPRDTIAEIVRLNQLRTSEVQAGQPIAVPLRFSAAPGVYRAEQLGL